MASQSVQDLMEGKTTPEEYVRSNLGESGKAEEDRENLRLLAKERVARGIYFVVVRPDEVDGGFVSECTDLPGCLSQGDTAGEAVANLGDAIDGILEVQTRQREGEMQAQHVQTVDLKYTAPRFESITQSLVFGDSAVRFKGFETPDVMVFVTAIASAPNGSTFIRGVTLDNKLFIAQAFFSKDNPQPPKAMLVCEEDWLRATEYNLQSWSPAE